MNSRITTCTEQEVLKICTTHQPIRRYTASFYSRARRLSTQRKNFWEEMKLILCWLRSSLGNLGRSIDCWRMNTCISLSRKLSKQGLFGSFSKKNQRQLNKLKQGRKPKCGDRSNNYHLSEASKTKVVSSPRPSGSRGYKPPCSRKMRYRSRRIEGALSSCR